LCSTSSSMSGTKPSASVIAARSAHASERPSAASFVAGERRSPELSHDLGEQFERLGAGVVGAPWDEPAASEVDVGPDLLGDLLGRADEVVGAPLLERLAPDGERPAGGDLGLGAADVHVGRPRHADLVGVAADGGAVVTQHVTLVGPLLGRPAEVRAVGVAGDGPQRELLAAAADPDRWVRLLDRLRIALGALDLVVLPGVGRLTLGPHRPHDLDGLGEHAEPVLRLREVVAVRAVLVL